MTPIQRAKRRAVACMTAAIAIHFAGYELARAATVSIFTSAGESQSPSDTNMILGGFGPRTAVMLPFAVFCVSPCSIFLLWTYSYNLEQIGPKRTVVRSTAIASLVMLVAVMVLQGLQSLAHVHSSSSGVTRLSYLYKSVVFTLLVFQNSNVQLLFTQHWSFLGSVLSSSEASIWFAPIAGVGSITSTLAAASVSFLLQRISLFSVLLLASLLIACSGYFAKAAYDISHQHGFDPSTSLKDRSSHTNMPTYQNKSILEKSKLLFERVPVMKLLFWEVIVSQSLSSLISFSFMVSVQNTILDNNERAGFTGNCYAWINGISGILQFFFLPLISRYTPTKIIWLSMPFCMLLLTSCQIFPFHQGVYQPSTYRPSLQLLTTTYSTMKILEYSVRSMMSERIYVDLDYESRYIGKEIINLLANRLGKSVIAATLATASYVAGKDEEVLSRWFYLCCHAAAWIWLLLSFKLSSFKTFTESKSES